MTQANSPPAAKTRQTRLSGTFAEHMPKPPPNHVSTRALTPANTNTKHPPPGRVRNPDHHRLTKELRDLRTSRFPRTHSSHNTASKLIAPATMASTRIALHDNIWAFEQLSCNSIPELHARQNPCTACEQAKPAMDRGPAIQCRDPLVS